MADPSWENAAPPPRKGLGLWGKIAIGCGAATLCFVLAVGGLVWWGFRKTTSILDEGWTQARQVVEAMRTPESALALYRANPGLAEDYPDEKAFLAMADALRPRLEEMPAQPPGLGELMARKKGGHRGFRFRIHREGGESLTSLRLPLRSGGRLIIERVDGKLTDLRVEEDSGKGSRDPLDFPEGSEDASR